MALKTSDAYAGPWLGELDLETFPRPYKGSGWTNVLQGIGQPISLPLMTARGVTDGPTVMAIAGVHGNEYEGMAAIRRVFADLNPSQMSGMFVGIPVANPFAFDSRSRVAPSDVDGLNLARIFPGALRGTPSQELAHNLLNFIERHIGIDDLLIDFHSGSHDTAFATVVGIRNVGSPSRTASERAARHFGISDLWLIPDSSGPLNATTSRLGIPTIGTETVGRSGCDPAGVASFTTGLRNVLALHGILANAPHPPEHTGAFRPTASLYATCSGLVEDAAQLYQQVEQGQSLGTVVDVFGNERDHIIAPNVGTIWAARTNPAVRTGELLFMVAHPEQ